MLRTPFFCIIIKTVGVGNNAGDSVDVMNKFLTLLV